MLVDLPVSVRKSTRFPLHRMQTGVYETDMLDFILKRNTKSCDDYPFSDVAWDDEMATANYGVADNIEQVLSRYPRLVSDDRQYVIEVQWVHRNPENKGKGGGWRWHKWGEYVGDFTPRWEHLDDEEGIDKVMLFHVYAVELLPDEED